MSDEAKHPDEQPTAHDIKLHEATNPTPRGNVHSEAEDGPEQEAPPPLPV